MRSEVYRFPKWLLEERFEVSHAPKLSEPFTVGIFDRVARRFEGSGHSIAEAAKAAAKIRDQKSEGGDQP